MQFRISVFLLPLNNCLVLTSIRIRWFLYFSEHFKIKENARKPRYIGNIGQIIYLKKNQKKTLTLLSSNIKMCQ